ncbi:MAG: hypothetical protein EBS42_16550, partial [Caulobacteraceae bacterium]|nr:hypothetical protein [Caulobacteraceae bacterium]
MRQGLETSRILVIKLSALGDFIQATGPMKAIRAFHDDAHITLLTTAPFEAMAQATGWFDEIWTDGRPAWSDLPAVARLLMRLRQGRFDRVYDLQTQSRTVRYFQLMWPARPPWSGNAPGAAFEYSGAARDRLHVQDSQRNQLAIAGPTGRPMRRNSMTGLASATSAPRATMVRRNGRSAAGRRKAKCLCGVPEAHAGHVTFCRPQYPWFASD